jgi:hypothetical protein
VLARLKSGKLIHDPTAQFGAIAAQVLTDACQLLHFAIPPWPDLLSSTDRVEMPSHKISIDVASSNGGSILQVLTGRWEDQLALSLRRKEHSHGNHHNENGQTNDAVDHKLLAYADRVCPFERNSLVLL